MIDILIFEIIANIRTHQKILVTPKVLCKTKIKEYFLCVKSKIILTEIHQR
jgi:hypothetical protein